MNDDLRRIEREIRDWTSRPLARPPRVARTRVLARIDERRPRGGWMFAAAAAMVAVLAFGLLLPRTLETPSGPPVRTAPSEPSPGLLVYELESGTKLYMALAVTSPFAKTTMERN